MNAFLNPLWPHDLLFLRALDAFMPAGAAPDWWTDAAWAGAPVVVRREATAAGLVAVGARGPRRNQRCAGYVPTGAVDRCVTPAQLAQLAQLALAVPAPLPHEPPCLAALRALAPQLDALGFDWGPAGGVGFQLASGLSVLRADSDLDLLVRFAQRPAPADLAALRALQDSQPCRIDIQIDTGGGGCALAELVELSASADAGRRGRVLLKTAQGPLLVDDPWAARAAA